MCKSSRSIIMCVKMSLKTIKNINFPQEMSEIIIQCIHILQLPLYVVVLIARGWDFTSSHPAHLFSSETKASEERHQKAGCVLH